MFIVSQTNNKKLFNFCNLGDATKRRKENEAKKNRPNDEKGNNNQSSLTFYCTKDIKCDRKFFLTSYLCSNAKMMVYVMTISID